MLESLFNKVTGIQGPFLKNICEQLLLRTSSISSTIIFQINTELLLHVQLSLPFRIICVISVDNKISRGLQLRKIKFNLHAPRILEIWLNHVKI